MANWATLRPYILLRIVNIYRNSIHLRSSDDVDIYVSFLELSQVCQRWRNIIKESLYTTAIILCHKPTAEQLLLYGNPSDSDQLASRGIYLAVSSPQPSLWRTNIPHIMQSKSSSYTQRLIISSRNAIIEYSSLGDILEIFGFSTVQWLSLERLYFTIDRSTSRQNSETKHPTATGISKRLSQTSQYFINHIPHMRYLRHNASMYLLKDLPAFPLGDVLNFYLPQLQTIALPDFTLPQLDHTYFSSFLTKLVLCINSESVERLPKIYAPSLKILILFYSGTAHSWHIFRGSLPGSVIFENLTVLTVFHFPDIFETVVGANAYFSQLSFPKLKTLRLDHYPFKDSNTLNLFKDAPIQTATIIYMANRFLPSALSTFRDTHNLFIGVNDGGVRPHDEATMSIAKNLFSKLSSTSTTEIRVQTSLPVLLPDTILWTKLEKLYLQFPVYLSDLIHILPQLPHLRWLLVGAIYNTGNSPENTESAPIWSTTLTQLILFSSIVDIPTIPSLDAMCILVFGLPSLLKLAVPDDILLSAKETLSEYVIPRESCEAECQVVGYSPRKAVFYLQDGVIYTEYKGK